MGSIPSEGKTTRWIVSTIFVLISVFSGAWAADSSSPSEVSKAVVLAVTGPSGNPWTRRTVTYGGAAQAYAADMEIEKPVAADFEPSRPELKQPPPADFERSSPLINDAPPTDFEPSQPEIEQPPPADFEPATPEVKELNE